jgi:hypothetical protein
MKLSYYSAKTKSNLKAAILDVVLSEIIQC